MGKRGKREISRRERAGHPGSLQTFSGRNAPAYPAPPAGNLTPLPGSVRRKVNGGVCRRGLAGVCGAVARAAEQGDTVCRGAGRVNSPGSERVLPPLRPSGSAVQPHPLPAPPGISLKQSCKKTRGLWRLSDFSWHGEKEEPRTLCYLPHGLWSLV